MIDCGRVVWPLVGGGGELTPEKVRRVAWRVGVCWFGRAAAAGGGLHEGCQQAVAVSQAIQKRVINFKCASPSRALLACSLVGNI